MKKLMVVVAAVAAAAACGDVTERTWTHKVGASQDIAWETVDGWDGGTVPTITTSDEGSSVAVKLVEETPLYQRLSFPNADKSYYLDSLSGGSNMVLKGGASLGRNKSLVIRDTSDFAGAFAVETPFFGFSYLGSSLLAHVDLSYRMRFRAQPGETVTLAHPCGTGAFDVNDVDGRTGTVKLLCAPGRETELMVHRGTLEIVGHSHDDAPRPAAAPWLHLDATEFSSLELSAATDGSGRTYVTRWNDVRGTGLSAAVEAGASSAPFLATDAESGTNVISFGACGNGTATNWKTETYGQSAWFKLSEQREDITALFVVFRDHNPTNGAFFFAGHSTSSPFYRSENTDGLGRYASLFSYNTTSQYQTDRALGDVRVDGQATRLQNSNFDFSRNLNVVSCALRDGATGALGYLGRNTSTGSSKGGGVIAEVIAYTNVLSAAARRETIDYLMKKWRRTSTNADVGNLRVNGAGVKISVLSGTTASVGTLAVASSAALVKEGDGTLEIGSFATPQQNIQVNAGDVRFAGNAALPLQPQPAADPYAWFDADNAETLQTVVSNYNGETYTFVTNWLDCRPDARNPRGKRMSLRNQQDISDSRCHGGKADSAWPTLDAASFARPMVDLGPFYNQTSSKDFGWDGGSSGLSTWLRLLQEDALMGATIREGFVVFVKTHSYAQPIAADDWTFRTAGADYNSRCWVNSSYADWATAAGLWWCDGVPIDATGSGLSGDNKAHLGHFALSYMRSANALGVDMNITGNGCGGCKIAEVIYYDRCLTDEERRETERYLMQKWNVGTHPADQPSVSSLAYADGQPARLATDRDISLASLTADAVLEKSGAGKLTVAGAMPEQTSIKVEEGSLDLNVDIAAGAFMHVDAERIDSLVFDKGVYDPSDPTNLVTRWNDWRGNGWYANADNTYKTAHPNYRKVMINGVEKPCLDFGDYVFTTSKLPGTTAASMAWSKEPKFLHGFIVCADSAKVANSTEDRQSIFGERDMAFFRFSKPYIIGTYSNENQNRIRSDDAYIGVNGEKKSYNWTVPYQTFHVFAFSPTNAMTAVNWFAQSRGDRFGGQQICEAIVFETDISVEKRTAIERYLMKKWLGLGDGAGWEQPMDEVSVANGATLKLRNDVGMIGPVAKLAGRGSVTMTQITNLSEVVVGDASGQAGTLAVAADVQVRDGAVLKVVIDEVGKVGRLAVEGALSFAGDVRVVLEKTGVTKTLCGEYTILSATELEGLDAAAFADWTFDTSVETRRNISFRYDATTKSVVMTVSPTGLMLLVR